MISKVQSGKFQTRKRIRSSTLQNKLFVTCFTFTFLQHKLGIFLFRIQTSDSNNNQNFYKSFTYCSTGHPLTAAEFGLISFGVGAILSFASILPCTMYVKKNNKKKTRQKTLGQIFKLRRLYDVRWWNENFGSYLLTESVFFNLKINSEGVF